MIRHKPKLNKIVNLSVELSHFSAISGLISKRQFTLARLDVRLHLLGEYLDSSANDILLLFIHMDIVHHAVNALLLGWSEVLADHRVVVDERNVLQ